MADPLYFACGWVIRPDIDYDALMHTAGECGCELVAVAPINMTQQGLAVMTFAVRTAEEANLVNFIRQYEPEMGLTHWYGVPESYYEQGSPLYVGLIPEDIRTQWLAGLNAYGKHNDEQRKKLTGN